MRNFIKNGSQIILALLITGGMAFAMQAPKVETQLSQIETPTTTTETPVVEASQEPKPKEVVEDTTSAPEPVVEPPAQPETHTQPSSSSMSLAEWLVELRQCETGGVYTTNTGNGYYGAYQFSIPTWNSIATQIGRNDLVGKLPSAASVADQDMMVVVNAKRASGGLKTQHPGCFLKLGLPQFPPEQ